MPLCEEDAARFGPLGEWQLKGFAVLAPDQTPLAIGGKLTPAALAALLGQTDNKAALAQSVGDDAVVAAALPGVPESEEATATRPKVA